MDAHIIYETGWQPDVLDAQPVGRVRAYLLYLQVRSVRENGGELAFPAPTPEKGHAPKTMPGFPTRNRRTARLEPSRGTETVAARQGPGGAGG